MVLKKELQELAQALKATREYAEMTSLRKKISGSPALGRQMMGFEREHARLLGLQLSEQEAAQRLDKLYADYKGFLAHQDVKAYVKSAQNYQDVIAENIKFLNGLLGA